MGQPPGLFNGRFAGPDRLKCGFCSEPREESRGKTSEGSQQTETAEKTSEGEEQITQATLRASGGAVGALGQLSSGLQLQPLEMPRANPVRNRAGPAIALFRLAPGAHSQAQREFNLSRRHDAPGTEALRYRTLPVPPCYRNGVRSQIGNL